MDPDDEDVVEFVVGPFVQAAQGDEDPDEEDDMIEFVQAAQGDGGAVAVDPLEAQLIAEAQAGNVEGVGALLNQGVNIEARSATGESALHHASELGHKDVVVLLRSRGANIEASDHSGWTPIIAASVNYQLEIVKLLYEEGADIEAFDVEGSTVLHHAAIWDSYAVCMFLVSVGADLMARDDGGSTAIADYGIVLDHPLSPETKALRIAALEAAWDAGPHPSQVQRRRDERWARRGPLLWVLAEHDYRPLLRRAHALDIKQLVEVNAMLLQHIHELKLAFAAGSVLPPVPNVVVQTSRMHEVFRTEGLVRYIVAFL